MQLLAVVTLVLSDLQPAVCLPAQKESWLVSDSKSSYSMAVAAACCLTTAGHQRR